MGESAESMFGRGMISAKAKARNFRPPILSKTKVDRPNEEEFHGRQGRRDQGGLRDRGTAVANSRAINNRQSMGTPAHAGGAPSGPGKRMGPGGGFTPRALRGTSDSGGRANATGQPRKGAIDQPEMQRPTFPAGGGGGGVRGNSFRSSIPGGGKPSPGGSSKGGWASPKRSKGTTRPMQRSGAQSGNYGASSGRP